MTRRSLLLSCVWALAFAASPAAGPFALPVAAFDGQVPAQAAAQPAAQAAPLSVMTFNIRYGTADDGENHWRLRREQLYSLLREQQADVVGLQEALRFQIDEIDYVFVEPGAEVIEAAIVRSSRDGRSPSDHFPVTARIRFR